MGIVFNIDEVYEMAGRIERNGAAFYRQAALQFPDFREILLTIAQQEDEHEAIFAAMRRQAAADAGGQAGANLDADGEAYLHALADSRVLDIRTKPEEKLANARSLADVIGTALTMEKDSIVFYLGLKQLVPPALGREQLNHIIEEEQRHIVFLLNLLDQKATPAT